MKFKEGQYVIITDHSVLNTIYKRVEIPVKIKELHESHPNIERYIIIMPDGETQIIHDAHIRACKEDTIVKLLKQVDAI